MTDDHTPETSSEHLGAPEVAPDSRDDLGDLGGLGGLDLGSLLGAAQTMQSQMMEAQQRIAETEVDGQAGGGAVKITVNGAYEFQRVKIDVVSIDPDDPSLLEDLVLAALHDATSRLADLHAEASPLAGIDMEGFGLGGLGAMFGGS